MLKSHPCGGLTGKEIGNQVVLCGWVQRKRDHGGVTFIDLRDRSGIVQVVFDPRECGQEVATLAREVGSEWVLKVSGVVHRRPPGTENPRLATGEIEVRAQEATVLNPASPLPFPVRDDVKGVDEILRLKYRYLDLRRPAMRQALELRHRFTKAVRDFMDQQGFWEVETPILWKHTPEGAREFLVPSRLHPGRFFVLPQSPQIAKQLLMVAGVEKYFQIARCLRDEDPRADRQPEFTQIDVEMSFVTADDIYELVEGLLSYALKVAAGRDIPTPFLKMSYQEAMTRYGSDKPDIRFGLLVEDVTDILKESSFRAFSDTVREGGIIRGLFVPGLETLGRKDLAELTELTKRAGAKGLATIPIGDRQQESLVARFLTEKEKEALASRFGSERPGWILLVADQADRVEEAVGLLRLKLARHRKLVPERCSQELAFLWIVDRPLLEWDAREERYVPLHHPFTSPFPEDIPLLEEGVRMLETGRGEKKGSPDHPLRRVRAYAYDIVLNGYEIGGGSIRIHDRSLQELVFRAIELPREEAKRKFGFLLEAFEYGAPPHGGIALGLDRILAVLCDAEQTDPDSGLPYLNIREVIAFPKTSTMADPLTGAPTPVDEKVLKEQHITLVPEVWAKVQQEAGGIGESNE
ncbi:MAG: aspartate--tRNA ligase [Armatimonadetes bacterium]|nr:aspartate--tRNA ligase [Armatimonadota bacterium]MDW8120968.1 aspartate--tRNA ligase [Armatimonadota bacterium]